MFSKKNHPATYIYPMQGSCIRIIFTRNDDKISVRSISFSPPSDTPSIPNKTILSIPISQTVLEKSISSEKKNGHNPAARFTAAALPGQKPFMYAPLFQGKKDEQHFVTITAETLERSIQSYRPDAIISQTACEPLLKGFRQCTPDCPQDAVFLYVSDDLCVVCGETRQGPWIRAMTNPISEYRDFKDELHLTLAANTSLDRPLAVIDTTQHTAGKDTIPYVSFSPAAIVTIRHIIPAVKNQFDFHSSITDTDIARSLIHLYSLTCPPLNFMRYPPESDKHSALILKWTALLIVTGLAFACLRSYRTTHNLQQELSLMKAPLSETTGKAAQHYKGFLQEQVKGTVNYAILKSINDIVRGRVVLESIQADKDMIILRCSAESSEIPTMEKMLQDIPEVTSVQTETSRRSGSDKVNAILKVKL